MTIAEYDALLFAAHAQALAKLSELLLTTEDPREIRLIATSLLRLRPITPLAPASSPPKPSAPVAAASPRPAEPSTSSAAGSTLASPPKTDNLPLTPAELAELASYLPHVPVARFTRKHTPAYWREALALQRRRGHLAPASAAA